MKKVTLLLMALTLVTANALAVVQNPPGGFFQAEDGIRDKGT